MAPAEDARDERKAVSPPPSLIKKHMTLIAILLYELVKEWVEKQKKEQGDLTD